MSVRRQSILVSSVYRHSPEQSPNPMLAWKNHPCPHSALTRVREEILRRRCLRCRLQRAETYYSQAQPEGQLTKKRTTRKAKRGGHRSVSTWFQPESGIRWVLPRAQGPCGGMCEKYGIKDMLAVKSQRRVLMCLGRCSGFLGSSVINGTTAPAPQEYDVTPDVVDRTSTRQGVVAVITRDEHFLVIRRSEFVRAPHMLCFPGGGVESGEQETDAIKREMQEELHANVRPIQRIWESRSQSGVQLFWWVVELMDLSWVKANPEEVEMIYWLTSEQLVKRPNLLATNREFLKLVNEQQIRLPD